MSIFVICSFKLSQKCRWCSGRNIICERTLTSILVSGLKYLRFYKSQCNLQRSNTYPVVRFVVRNGTTILTMRVYLKNTYESNVILNLCSFFHAYSLQILTIWQMLFTKFDFWGFFWRQLLILWKPVLLLEYEYYYVYYLCVFVVCRCDKEETHLDIEVTINGSCQEFSYARGPYLDEQLQVQSSTTLSPSTPKKPASSNLLLAKFKSKPQMQSNNFALV